MKIHVRKAISSEYEEIHSLIRELAEFEHLGHEFRLAPERLKELLNGHIPGVHALLAFCNGKTCGLLLYFYTVSTFSGRPNIFIEDLYIRPEYRRNGIGGRMIDYLKNTAAGSECGKIEWKVLAGNTPAIEFYRKMGGSENINWLTYELPLA